MIVLKNRDSRHAILYYQEVDIDGFHCRDEFAKLIADTGSKRHYCRAHEWCCGHGAIGFRSVESGLCDKLVLTDKYEPATVGCEFTVAANDLQHRVTVYNTADLGSLPGDEKWDLFVANPPWRSIFQPGPAVSDDIMRKMFDLEWQAHHDLYHNIAQYLTADADVYIYEDSRFSSADTWNQMIARAGLCLKEIHAPFGLVDTGYVMHLKKNNFHYL